MGQGVFGLAGASLLFSLPVLTQSFGAVAGSLAGSSELEARCPVDFNSR